jgi:hypothetical protein
MARKGYWREISAVLVLKTVGILLLYCLFVVSLGPSEMAPASVAEHLAPANAMPAR